MEEKECILIIDDDEGSCKTLNLIFNKKGFKTETALTGKEALEKLKKRFYNVILLDIRLPDIEGIELLTPIKQIHPDMDVIMITAYASIDTAVRALNEGAAAFITKPVNMDEVLAIINIVLNKQRLITEKRQAEQKLKESELKFRVLFEDALNPILIFDENGRYIDVNEAACRFLESEKENIIGKVVWDYSPPELLNKQRINHSPFFSRHILETEYNVKAKIKTLLLNVVPIDSNGKKLLYGIGQDITERKKVEEKLEKSEKKYRKAYEQVNFYKDLFSHDINNIIHAINSSAELYIQCKSKLKEFQLEDIIIRIENSSKQAIRLIFNVRKLSELEEGLVISLKEVDVIRVLDEAINNTRRSFQEKEIDIKTNVSDKTIKIQANEFLLDVFENILNNAVKYNENLIIKIDINVSNVILNKKGYIKMEFIDNGTGIPDDRKEIIFQKGFKKLKGVKGMGIGLSLVKTLVERYNGKIWIEDMVKGDYSKGSKFILLIPEMISVDQ